jgi:hypothetical protein
MWWVGRVLITWASCPPILPQLLCQAGGRTWVTTTGRISLTLLVDAHDLCITWVTKDSPLKQGTCWKTGSAGLWQISSYCRNSWWQEKGRKLGLDWTCSNSCLVEPPSTELRHWQERTKELGKSPPLLQSDDKRQWLEVNQCQTWPSSLG